jgi:ribonucleoside-diphosphate reductase alpha chain
LIDRFVKTFKKWGLEQFYFNKKEAEIYKKELTYIILHQYATFNSPFWFNVGVEGRSQQCSACFILDVEDNMGPILDWIKIEGMIFKGGSGSGVNLSKLRDKGEKLSTGVLLQELFHLSEQQMLLLEVLKVEVRHVGRQKW